MVRAKKRKLKKGSTAASRELYRYPRHTSIEIIPDLRNPRRVILVPFPPGDRLAVRISKWLMDRHSGEAVTKELIVEMTFEARWYFCRLRNIPCAIQIEEQTEDNELQEVVAQDTWEQLGELDYPSDVGD